MVCKPVPWQSNCEDGRKPRTLFELKGGYLTHISDMEHNLRYVLRCSHNRDLFNINLIENHEALCTVMNKLQDQPFQINSVLLKLILTERDKFERLGMLIPRFLQHQVKSHVAEVIRSCHRSNPIISSCWSYSELLSMICVHIQLACYEQFIIDLASAYDGYKFYLPVYMDFRGRIYRAGLLHFHERDFAV
jgi:DNA-directed RNA polymerase